jgi:hypothetical protein
MPGKVMGNAMFKPMQDRKYRVPRIWSNDVLRQIAPVFKGSVINVSGWRDEDKQGGHYRDYFTSAASYSISNMGGYRGESPDTSYVVDLEASLPPELEGRFDVVYNHTTLEHVFDVFSAVRNLCAMTRDVVIVVVPFIQEQHAHDDFSDYWRFTPLCIRALFKANGLDTVLLCSTPGYRSAIYHLAIASRHPGRWTGAFNTVSVNENTGQEFFNNPMRDLFRRIAGRKDGSD